jgi:hypothetical protein
MSKAIEGAAMFAGAVGMGVAAFLDPALIASPLFDKAMAALVLGGISMEAGAIAQALTSNRGTNITTRQPAAYRQVILGESRVGGVLVYSSTTGGNHDQWNKVIVLAGHPCNAIVNLYLDGRKVYWDTSSAGNQTVGGFNFGGQANGTDYYDEGNNKYNFGGLVYCEAVYGDQADGTVLASLTANDPTWAASSAGSPWLGGCTYLYLKVEYDSAMFPSDPEVRVNVQGRNDIYDPRAGTTGFTDNWTLCVAHVLNNSDYGLNVPQSLINQDQLIAAANVCDEQVALANGQTEDRYTCNVAFDTSTTPGDILDQMMYAAAGRLSRIGAQWFIWPAYWQGPSFSWDQNALVDTPSWRPYRKPDEIFNRVKGVYVAPNYPYQLSGNLYDDNGFFDGTRQNNFQFEWQRTDYPPYAEDTLHGYSSDQFYAEDGDQDLWKDIEQKCCISVATSQRVAKIYLLRNRFQGTGMLPMMVTAFQMQPIDVMLMTFPRLGWTNQMLELGKFRLVLSDGEETEDGSKPPTWTVSVDVNQTDPSIYEWSIDEELLPSDAPGVMTQYSYQVQPPTDITLTSGASTAVEGADGVVQPRIEVSWNAPLDGLVTLIQIQYQLNGASTWIDGPVADVGNFSAFVSGVVAGLVYIVRIRSIRGSNGATSAWLTSSAYTVSDTLSSVTSSGLNPNSPYNIGNDALIDSVVDGSSADIRIYGPSGVGSAWDNYTGQGNASYPAATLTGMAFDTQYSVIFDTGTSEYSALTDYLDTLPDSYINLGSVLTVESGGTGGSSGGGSGSGGGAPRPTPVL